MKKKYPLLLLTLLLITGLIPSISANAENYSKTQEEGIINTINEFIDNSLSIKRDWKIKENNTIDKKTKLYEYNKLLSETSLKWYKGTGLKIDWFKTKTKINSIENKNELIEVNADINIKCQYTDVSVDTEYIENYIFTFKKVGNKFVIVKAILNQDIESNEINKLTKSESNYDQYIDQKISQQKEVLANIDEDIKSANKDMEEAKSRSMEEDKSPRLAYNRTSATNWALANAFSAEDYKGNDCTNFVSKALAMGGLPQDSTWKKGTNAWIRVIELRNYLTSKGRAKQYSSTGSADIGDVIQLYNKSKGNWTHSLFVTYDVGGRILVTAHSNAAKNKDFRDYYPTSTYSSYRVLHVTY